MIEIHLRQGIMRECADDKRWIQLLFEPPWRATLVSLLQGSVESDDSSESDGDGEEEDKAQVDNFSELDSKLERVGLEVLQPDMSSDNLVIKPGKAKSGAEKAVNL